MTRPHRARHCRDRRDRRDPLSSGSGGLCISGGWSRRNPRRSTGRQTCFRTSRADRSSAPRWSATSTNGAEVTRLLYHSTDPDGEPIAVSGIAITPPGEPPSDGWPVVAWAHGTTGIASRCAPSLESGAGAHLIPALTELTDGGYVVVATDYPGLGTPGPHPYLVGESEGRRGARRHSGRASPPRC